MKYLCTEYRMGNLIRLILTKWNIDMSRMDEIKNLAAELEGELDKFYNKGNKAAGTRARKQLQELKKLSQEIRLEIQDIKNKD